MAETLYQKTASHENPADPADPGASGSGKPDDVVDAEYTVKE
jgi:hypothetical protein